MIDVPAMQARMITEELDGWLLYDFRGSNPLAQTILKLPLDRHRSRRWFYYIPASGEPVGLVHRLEPLALEGLPGSRIDYLSHQDLRTALEQVLSGARRIAMEYSPEARNPYVSTVDAGTVELVRGAGVAIASSADLVQYFEARWPERAYPLYRKAARALIDIKNRAFEQVAAALRDGVPMTEQDVARRIMEGEAAAGLVAEPPIVAVGAHASDPHYATLNRPDAVIELDRPLLIDLFARADDPDATVADFTFMAWTGHTPADRFLEIWNVAARARDAAVTRVREAIEAGTPMQGWEVDAIARGIIDDAGYGEYFVHRTGHSLGRETHGAGVHADNLEMRDERLLIPGIAFTVEPGIYLPEFGVRTEVNVLVHEQEIEVWADPMQRAPDVLGPPGKTPGGRP